MNSNKTEKYSFKISKRNIIYVTIISVLIIVSKIRKTELDAENFGILIGTIIGYFLFPTIIALFFWWLLGRKKNGGNLSFAIFFTLMIFGQFTEFVKKTSERNEPIKDMQKSISEYKKELQKNPYSTSNENYIKYSNSIKKNINSLIKTSKGNEKKVFILLKDFFNKSDIMNNKWLNSYSELSKDRILDFTKLNDKKECDFQISVIEKYKTNSMEYREFFKQRIPIIMEKIDEFPKNDKFIKGVLNGIRKKDSLQKPVFIPYISNHIKYGEKLVELVKLLKKENQKWKYKNDEIIFDNTKIQMKYEILINTISDIEIRVNELYDELINTL